MDERVYGTIVPLTKGERSTHSDTFHSCARFEPPFWGFRSCAFLMLLRIKGVFREGAAREVLILQLNKILFHSSFEEFYTKKFLINTLLGRNRESKKIHERYFKGKPSEIVKLMKLYEPRFNTSVNFPSPQFAYFTKKDHRHSKPPSLFSEWCCDLH